MRGAGHILGELIGTGHPGDEVTVETDSFEDGGVGYVNLTIDFVGLEANVTLDIDAAENLLVELRDETVRAKQKELAWRTNTDPKRGIEEDDE